MQSDYRELAQTAAVYIRVSSKKESQKDSPEHQRAVCLEKARMENLDVQYFYEDRSSGTSIKNREEIQQLIKDAQKGHFQTVIFASMSRFSRDTHDALGLKKILVDALGIRLISLDENFDSNMDKDELKFTLHAIINQNLAEQISLSSRRGIRQSAKKGNFTGSHAPFGYKKVNTAASKTLEIVPENAEVIRHIFNLYVKENLGDKAVTNHLNDEGIPSPKGSIWQVTSVQRILQNEAYTGRNVFGKYTVKKVFNDLNDLQDRSKKLVQREKDEWERNEERNWEAIIDDELFERAQYLRGLRGGGKRGGARNIVNVFAGVVFCSHCGGSMVAKKSGKKGKDGQEYRYLICSSRNRGGEKGCINGTWIPYDKFKKCVFFQINKIVKPYLDLEKEKVDYETELRSRHIKEVEVDRDAIKKLEGDIEKTRKYLFELRKEFKFGDLDKEQFDLERNEVEKEITKLQKELERNMSCQAPKRLDDKMIEEVLEEYVKAAEKILRLEHTDNVQELNVLVKFFTPKIEVSQDFFVHIYSPLVDVSKSL